MILPVASATGVAASTEQEELAPASLSSVQLTAATLLASRPVTTAFTFVTVQPAVYAGAVPATKPVPFPAEIVELASAALVAP